MELSQKAADMYAEKVPEQKRVIITELSKRPPLHLLAKAIPLINQLRPIWQGLQFVNGTLEEWVKKSDAEMAAIDDEIRQLRELLDEKY